MHIFEQRYTSVANKLDVIEKNVQWKAAKNETNLTLSVSIVLNSTGLN